MIYNIFTKNLIVSLMLLLLIIVLIVFELNKFIKSKNEIDIQTLIDLINHKNAIIIDFREKNEFKKCHITNSINITDEKIKNNIYQFKKYKKRHIIIIHQTHKKARKIIKLLKPHLEKISYLKDGINSWKKMNY